MQHRPRDGRNLTQIALRVISSFVITLACGTTMADENHGAMDIDYAFTVPTPFYNTGDLYVFNGGSISGDLIGGNSLNIGIDSNYLVKTNDFTTDGLIGGIDNVHIFNGSTFTANDQVSGITTGFVVDAGATATFNASITGAGGILINRGTTTLNDCSIGMTALSNTGVLNVNGSVFNIASWVNYNTINIANTLTGYGPIYNATGATLTFADNANSSAPITNDGTLDINGISAISADITNNNRMNITNSLSGAGSIINTSGAILSLNNNATVANSIFNQAGGTINAAGVCAILNNAGTVNINNSFSSADVVTNLGTLNVNAAFDTAAAIINSGTCNVASNISMPGQTFTNSGILNILGDRTIDADQIISPGVINIGVYDTTSCDYLTATNIVDLRNGAVINVNSDFIGEVDTAYAWEVIEAPTILIDDSTVVNLGSSLVKIWDVDSSPDALDIIYTRLSFASQTTEELHTQIANILDNIQIGDGTHIHGPLLSALASSSTQAALEAALMQLLPNVNAPSNSVAVQDATFTKVETRLTTLRNGIPHVPVGQAYGDITIDTALWAGAFGTVANQKAYSKSYGYNANASGAILGIDHFSDDGDIIGLAFAVSNSNVHEALNLGYTTRTLGYHVIAYGSKDVVTDTLFLEWLLTGIHNENHGVRMVRVNNHTFGVNSSYRTAQGGARLNFGQTTHNDAWQFSLVEMVSYALLYQPTYNELNSPAALHVNPQRYSNYLTVGGGVRLAIMQDNTWLRGAKELRFMGTYDAITTNQAFTSSFINSPGDFTVTNNAGRWGFQAGATYTFTFFESLQLQFSYDFELRTKYTENSGEIKLRYLF